MKKILNSESGQALITLLFFMVIGITVISAAVVVLFINNLSATTTEQGAVAYYLAESGAEDGVLVLLRDPSKRTGTYTYSPILGSSQISVTLTNGTIVSTGTSGNSVRKIQLQTVYNNGAFTVSSWKEIN